MADRHGDGRTDARGEVRQTILTLVRVVVYSALVVAALYVCALVAFMVVSS